MAVGYWLVGWVDVATRTVWKLNQILKMVAFPATSEAHQGQGRKQASWWAFDGTLHSSTWSASRLNNNLPEGIGDPPYICAPAACSFHAQPVGWVDVATVLVRRLEQILKMAAFSATPEAHQGRGRKQEGAVS